MTSLFELSYDDLTVDLFSMAVLCFHFKYNRTLTSQYKSLLPIFFAVFYNLTVLCSSASIHLSTASLASCWTSSIKMRCLSFFNNTRTCRWWLFTSSLLLRLLRSSLLTTSSWWQRWIVRVSLTTHSLCPLFPNTISLTPQRMFLYYIISSWDSSIWVIQAIFPFARPLVCRRSSTVCIISISIAIRRIMETKPILIVKTWSTSNYSSNTMNYCWWFFLVSSKLITSRAAHWYGCFLFFLFYRSICWFWIMSLCILFFITLTTIIMLLFCSWIWSNCILVMRLIISRITLVVLCFLNTFPLTLRCYRRVWECTSLPSRRISSTWCIWRRTRRFPQPPSSVQFYYHPLVAILSPVLSILCIWITCTHSFMHILNLHSYYYNNMFPCWWRMYDSFCHVLLSSVVYYNTVWRMRAVYPSRLHAINCFQTQNSLYIITTSFSICWSICRWSLPTNTFPYAICYWTLTRTCLRSSSSLSLSMYVFDALFISSCHSLRWSPASFICWTSTPISWVTVPFFWLGIPMIIFPSNTTIPFFSSFFFCITTSPSPWTSLFPSCDSWRCLLPILSYRLSFALSSKPWMLPMINSSSRCILPCWVGSNQKCRWFLRSRAISTCCSSFNPISLFFLPCPRSGPRWRNRRLSL